MRTKSFLFVFLLILISAGCSTTGKEEFYSYTPEISTNKINFTLTAYDTDIDNPAMDRRCYYRVYINKIDSGRTTTGLESQEKYFETALSPNRHLIKLEKWVLDEEQGRYLKVNNIEQPKPDFIYITVTESAKIKVTMKSTRFGNAAFSKNTE